MSTSTGIPTQGSLPPSSSSNHLNLALAQIEALPADSSSDSPTSPSSSSSSSLDKLSQITAQAASHGADVVVFPEYFLTGTTHDDWRRVREEGGPVKPIGLERDHVTEDHWLHEVIELALKHNIDIVAGTVVELGTHHAAQLPKKAQAEERKEAASLYNTCYYVERTGKILARYTKRNLWHPERQVLTAAPLPPLLAASQDTSSRTQVQASAQSLSASNAHGHEHPKQFTITTKRGGEFTAGMLICWDLAWPDIFRSYLVRDGDRLRGPDIFFVPTCWYATDSGEQGLKWNRNGEASLLDALVVTRAIENEAVVAMCNIAGPDWPSSSTQASSLPPDLAVGVGRTAVAAPFLGAIERLEHPREALLLAQVDMRVLLDAREVYKMKEDLHEMCSTQVNAS